MAGTIFEASKLPLVKWFCAIYLMASDKGVISALRLAQQIEGSWITAHRKYDPSGSASSGQRIPVQKNSFVSLSSSENQSSDILSD